MATPKINENSHYVQNDPHKLKIKLEKFHFDIFSVLELLRKVSQGGNPPQVSRVKYQNAQRV